MRHLYNEDYTNLNITDSSVTIKSSEMIKSQHVETDKKRDMKVTEEKLGDVNNIHSEVKNVPESKNQPEELTQSFSTPSGIGLPMATRFVRCFFHLCYM